MTEAWADPCDACGHSRFTHDLPEGACSICERRRALDPNGLSDCEDGYQGHEEGTMDDEELRTTTIGVPDGHTIYQDEGGGWRVRFVAANGRITFVSGEAYASKSNAVRAARDFRESVHDSVVAERRAFGLDAEP